MPVQSINRFLVILTILLLFPVLIFAEPKEIPKKVIEKKAQFEKPFILIIDKEISGSYFGKKISDPFGVDASWTGYLYVVDAGNNRIIRFKENLEADRDIGGYGNQPGLFDEPSFISLDNSLNLIVSDAGNRRLVKYDSKLNFFDEIPFDDEEDPLKFSYLSGSALTGYGELWLADNQNNRIAVYNNIGQFDHFIGEFGYSGGALQSPEKIIADSNHNFIVCDAGNRRLVIYDDYGNYKKVIKNDNFQYPIACALDSKKNLWVIDNADGIVYSFDEKYNLIYNAGPLFPGNTKPIKNPSDITFLNDGRLVISDSGNNRVLICKIIQTMQ